MTDAEVVKALAALAQESRLKVFRLLIVAGPGGVTPGARALPRLQRGQHSHGTGAPVRARPAREKPAGHDGLRSKSWDEFALPDAPRMDFVITVCDKAKAEVCPVWPGQPMSAHWGVEDPAQAGGSEEHRRKAFSDALMLMSRRIAIFANLPLEKLNKLALQSELDRIGRER